MFTSIKTSAVVEDSQNMLPFNDLTISECVPLFIVSLQAFATHPIKMPVRTVTRVPMFAPDVFVITIKLDLAVNKLVFSSVKKFCEAHVTLWVLCGNSQRPNGDKRRNYVCRR